MPLPISIERTRIRHSEIDDPETPAAQLVNEQRAVYRQSRGVQRAIAPRSGTSCWVNLLVALG